VTGDERQNDWMLPHRGVVAVLGKQVEQPCRSGRFPVVATRRAYGSRPAAGYASRPSFVHADMIRTRILQRWKRQHQAQRAAAAKCSNRAVPDWPQQPFIGS
jgi:hypothetical protein